MLDATLRDRAQGLLKASGQNIPTMKPILEINPHHPIILKVSNETDEQKFTDWARTSVQAREPTSEDYEVLRRFVAANVHRRHHGPPRAHEVWLERLLAHAARAATDRCA